MIQHSVFTCRSILTAAHCVCNLRPNPEAYPKCLPNTNKNKPANQIIQGRDIFYVVGQQITDERLLSEKQYGEVLYDLPKAQKAFIYNGFISKRSKPDIGLLIVDISYWDNRVAHNLVRPIELPDKG